MKEFNKKLKYLGTIIGIIGIGIIVYFSSWIIAIGIFLMLWGNNIHIEEIRNENKLGRS